MALYHMSARIIGRSQGRSSVQVAAYQAREKLTDQRTGLHHDSSRKEGLLHAEVISPPNTPAWMKDREKLWNAVEQAEKRKDSQVARWFDLALPHELTHQQHRELLTSFVREQWVSKDLVADIAIHGPGDDQRNHHAHVLLTTRSVTPDGFGPKAFRGNHAIREAILQDERKAWAEHQNRTFERLGLEVRVDHRSFEDRGIDREPTKHMGPSASQREIKEPSRIGNENRAIEQDNREIVDSYVAQAQAIKPLAVPPPRPFRRAHIEPAFRRAIQPPETRLDRAWAQRDHERRVDLETRERHALLDLDRKHQPAKIAFEAELETRNARMKATIKADIEAMDRRAKAKGVTRFFYRLVGKFNDDAHRRENHHKTLEMIDRRENEERAVFYDRQNQERLRLIEKYRLLRFKLEKSLSHDFEIRNARMTKGPERTGKPPKLEPHYQPAPPRGAGPERMPANQETFERKVKEWAATPEGQKATLTPSQQKARGDWYRANPKPPEPSRTREDWYNSAPAKPRAPPRERERD